MHDKAIQLYTYICVLFQIILHLGYNKILNIDLFAVH